MKYFHLFICLFLTGISLYLFLRFYFKMRKDYFLKKIQTAVFNEQASLNHRVFFSSWVIISALKKAFHFSKQERDFLLSYLLKGEIENAASLFDKTDAVWIASGLRAFLDPKKQINLLENLIKANPENQNLLLLLTEIYFTLGEYQKFKLALSSISQNTPYSTAKKFYWEAYNYLQEGDLLSASENLSKAVKIWESILAEVVEKENNVLKFDVCISLYYCYNDGLGVAKDEEKSNELLSLIFEDPSSYRKKLKWDKDNNPIRFTFEDRFIKIPSKARVTEIPF